MTRFVVQPGVTITVSGDVDDDVSITGGSGSDTITVSGPTVGDDVSIRLP